jgi:hypothetical protein
MKHLYSGGQILRNLSKMKERMSFCFRLWNTTNRFPFHEREVGSTANIKIKFDITFLHIMMAVSVETTMFIVLSLHE